MYVTLMAQCMGKKKYEAWQLYMAKKNEKMEEYPIQI